MKGFDGVPSEVASDLIKLINSVSGLAKTKSVSYPTRTGIKSFHYVPLDEILEKIKGNNDFALMQPIGTNENGITGIKCILIHKSGHVFESDIYPLQLSIKKTDDENITLQDIGSEITYRKRYALGSFLGMTTEDDDDGNYSEALGTFERKATKKQVETILKNFQGSSIDKILKKNKIDKIEDLTLKTASELIKKIIEKVKK